MIEELAIAVGALRALLEPGQGPASVGIALDAAGLPATIERVYAAARAAQYSREDALQLLTACLRLSPTFLADRLARARVHLAHLHTRELGGGARGWMVACRDSQWTQA